MCGFVVIAQAEGSTPAALLNHMAAALEHRGPDGHGVLIGPRVAMHHKRLAIIDVAGGAQPMQAEGVSLVFNGEIYNYRELRTELIGLGHRFATASDTEVLLRAYLQWGADAVPRFNGMFAFVLHDQRSNSLLAARDAFGVKPLYRVRVGEQLIYASEIKALLRHPQVRREIDPVALEDYLSLQLVMGERTMFRGIEKLEPSHLEVVTLASLRVQRRRYWTLSLEARERNLPADEVTDLLQASVNRQMRSDVPVGAMLSGGLDSSMIAALASERLRTDTGAPMPTFTGAFHEGPAYDESAHARAVAEHVGARMHTIYPTEQQFVDELPAMVLAMDEPTAGPGLFPQFVVAREASKEVRVCLGGQGGDELFAGYARYLIGALQESLGASVSGEAITRSSLSLGQIEPSLGGLSNYQPLIKKVLGSGLDLPGHERYFQIMNRLDTSAGLLSGGLRVQLQHSQVAERFEAVFNGPREVSHLKKMMHFDLMVNLPSLLHVEDRASMAASLESRVPFLDTALAERVMAAPDRTLLEGSFSKAILRQAAQNWLPDSIVHRTDKMGFPVPLQRWIKGPAREFVRDTLLSRAARERGLFDPVQIEHLIDNENEFGRALWGALQLELWHRQFLDADHQVPVYRDERIAEAVLLA